METLKTVTMFGKIWDNKAIENAELEISNALNYGDTLIVAELATKALSEVKTAHRLANRTGEKIELAWKL